LKDFERIENQVVQINFKVQFLQVPEGNQENNNQKPVGAASAPFYEISKM
jgi:hypothetical protein